MQRSGVCSIDMDAAKNVTASFALLATPDGTPDVFHFVDQTGVAAGVVVTSNMVTISGINIPTTVSVTGGAYSIGCGSSYVTADGSITNGQTVCVRQAASMSPGATTNTGLTVGGVSDTFSVTTADSTPDAFQFVDQTGITPGAVVTSNEVTISGSQCPDNSFSHRRRLLDWLRIRLCDGRRHHLKWSRVCVRQSASRAQHHNQYRADSWRRIGYVQHYHCRHYRYHSSKDHRGTVRHQH